MQVTIRLAAFSVALLLAPIVCRAADVSDPDGAHHRVGATRVGGPEVLKYENIPEPALRKDHVLVRVRACALNHLDLFVRKGLPGVKLPHILGSDIAGEVVDSGEYFTDLQ